MTWPIEEDPNADIDELRSTLAEFREHLNRLPGPVMDALFRIQSLERVFAQVPGAGEDPELRRQWYDAYRTIGRDLEDT